MSSSNGQDLLADSDPLSPPDQHSTRQELLDYIQYLQSSRNSYRDELTKTTKELQDMSEALENLQKLLTVTEKHIGVLEATIEVQKKSIRELEVRGAQAQLIVASSDIPD